MYVHNLTKGTVHHAYIVTAGTDSFGALETAVESIFGTSLATSPDVLKIERKEFLVGDARSVVSFAQSSPLIKGGKKIILISFAFITVEAQNALLKSLEEPSNATHIFLLTPNPAILLPTVLSRCALIELSDESEGVGIAKGQKSLANEFIIASFDERLKIITKLVKKNKDKKIDKLPILILLDGIEEHLAQSNNKKSEEWQLATKAVLQAKKYVYDKGAMVKMLLESVALVL